MASTTTSSPKSRATNGRRKSAKNGVRKTSAKKSGAKSGARKTTAKAAAKKAPAKKAPAKKTTTKRSGVKKSATRRKYSRGASASVGNELREFESGTARSGRSGKKVASRKQAIAIGLEEARRSGEKVPPNPNRRKKA